MTDRRGWRRWLAHLLAGTLVLLGLVALTPAAPAEALCNGRNWFGGKHYCPATIESVTAGQNGVGQRVWLDEALVYAVTPTTVRVDQERYQECLPGRICGAGFFSTVSLTVAWAGSGRPATGLVVRLYGTTTGSSLSPVGYATIRDCGPRFERC